MVQHNRVIMLLQSILFKSNLNYINYKCVFKVPPSKVRYYLKSEVYCKENKVR